MEQVEDSAYLAANSAGDDGICDFTLSEVFQSQLNLNFLRDELSGVSWTQYVFGQRLRYTYTENLQSVSVLDHNLYYSPSYLNSITAGAGNPEKIGYFICQTMQDSCPNTWEYNSFASFSDCVEKMAALPLATINDRGLSTFDGNSTVCKAVHASLANGDPKGHCAHSSYLPMEDSKGIIKCSEQGENNLSTEDLFDEGDFNLFTRVALSFGMNATEQFRGGLAKDDLATCSANVVDVNAVLGAHFLPPAYLCSHYLNIQDATGESDTQYWLTLLGMFVFFRFAAFFFLRHKASRPNRS